MTKKKLYFFVFVACMAGYVWVFFNLFYHSNRHVGCLFHKITHIPCPSCGSTRSVLSLLQGHWGDAFYANPFGFLITVLMIVLPLWIAGDVLSKKESFFRSYQTIESLIKKKSIAIPALALVLSNWIWNIFKYL
ncbi:MAG: DUF2752 domain-containing protein [Candidatus Symbiothrix sp.]|jgi:hypothetical protein|nr:DUF2752 domain-containing protein [Candidatus Symbiothrix sp.]